MKAPIHFKSTLTALKKNIIDKNLPFLILFTIAPNLSNAIDENTKKVAPVKSEVSCVGVSIPFFSDHGSIRELHNLDVDLKISKDKNGKYGYRADYKFSLGGVTTKEIIYDTKYEETYNTVPFDMDLRDFGSLVNSFYPNLTFKEIHIIKVWNVDVENNRTIGRGVGLIELYQYNYDSDLVLIGTIYKHITRGIWGYCKNLQS